MAGDFDLHQLLAGPIIAMNDAQADAAASFYELFEQFAFDPASVAPDGAQEPRRLKTISFIAERATPDGIERRQISMPLLQMLPIGGVAIDSARIQFSLAINAEPAATKSMRRATPAAAGERAIALKGRIAPAAAAASEAGNLQVEIVLKQVDLPAGYLDMLAETQGGMSCRLAEDEAVLFEAGFLEPRNPVIAPSRELAILIDVVANPRLVGKEGLELTMKGEPAGAIRMVEPPQSVRLDAGRQSLRIALRTPARMPAGDIAMLLTGTAIGADGIWRTHETRLPLGREGTRK